MVIIYRVLLKCNLKWYWQQNKHIGHKIIIFYTQKKMYIKWLASDKNAQKL